MKYIILVLFLKCFLISNIHAIENKIIFKIENEIVTTLDLQNEIIYLGVLNPNIKSLNKENLNKIAKNSLIREKIKKNELLKYLDEIKLDQNFLNRLIRDRYSRLELNNKEEFLRYLNKNNININVIEEKISIEALWNQLIYQKFSSSVKIDEEKLKEQIEATLGSEINYLLSEIVFSVENKINLNEKYLEISNSIINNGFENTALKYSISDSLQLGGKLGWIKESSLNKKIIDNLKNLKKNDITKPIFTPNGYIILKIDDLKLTKKKYDKSKELESLIRSKTNQQLNQYSTIYFNKIKKNTNINEF